MDDHRLPRDISPIRYDLELEPDLESCTFRGVCAVEIELASDTTKMVLNAIELAVTKAWVTDSDGATHLASQISFDESTERVSFAFAAPITSRRATLHTEFSGILNDKLHGFYRSSFIDANGDDQLIATTQFEATDARRAFPCWDEPDFKASFAVTLVVDAEVAALSNAREVSREPRADGKHVVRFADTIVMSTYLVAFIVGPFDVTDPILANGKEMRVAYPKGKGHLTSYALEVGKFCLEYFADYYGIDYPGDKLDLVAVPDFAFGAMENLGCVTFREVLVLVDPETATQPELQNVTDVIAHELAHMWFGDLVTMKWWNGIWLNEAFATFMEMMATDAFRPEWDRWTTFGLSRTAAFDVDALKTTRPIEFPVISPTDAEGMFDILTYEKGAAAVRMLEQYLGAEPFRDGIREYLQKNAYQNTETTDLWDALEEATGEPVRRIMDSWIFQGGFPVIDIDIERDAIEVASPGVLRFRQRRFGYSGRHDNEPDSTQRWVVPLIFSQKVNDVITFERVLVEDEMLEIPLVEPIDWVLANTEGTGFYRTSYEPSLRESVVRHAQNDLSPIERYGLVDDSWAAVLADRLSTIDFLDLVDDFSEETDLSVWQRMIAGLFALDRLVQDRPREVLQERIRALGQPALSRLGLARKAEESDRDAELRGALFDLVGGLGRDSDTQSIARDLYSSSTRNPGSVDPTMVAASIAIVAATGTAADFDDFVERFRHADNPQAELRYLSALADFDNSALMARVLEMSLKDDVRTQNAPYLLRRSMSNRNHGPQAWAFVQDNWAAINERFPSNSIARLLEGVRGLSEPAVADSVFAFFSTHEVPQGEKILAQHLERLEVNVALRAREADALAQHLLGQ